MDGSTFWGLVIGTAIGIAAGAFVQYFAQRVFLAFQAKSLRNALCRELAYNISVTENLLEEVARFRTKVGSGTLTSYFGVFKLTDAFFVMANQSLATGLLYHLAEHKVLLRLQKAATFYSQASEAWIGNHIQLLKNGSGDAASFADFIERELRAHKETFLELTRELPRKQVPFFGFGGSPTIGQG